MFAERLAVWLVVWAGIEPATQGFSALEFMNNMDNHERKPAILLHSIFISFVKNRIKTTFVVPMLYQIS